MTSHTIKANANHTLSILAFILRVILCSRCPKRSALNVAEGGQADQQCTDLLARPTTATRGPAPSPCTVANQETPGTPHAILSPQVQPIQPAPISPSRPIPIQDAEARRPVRREVRFILPGEVGSVGFESHASSISNSLDDNAEDLLFTMEL
ncbi:hypothetical protein CONPUDRAFT_137400 [Coniophora puteana RWD-64-598 SS2]|uniref:Uncharacterized protein n=1 Tax=Coniophora puteana (strain RWD-64-598) TaxID=741705 RepID=A0A5M3MS49_CONPW|nr:uncharacterized protein CONPUDRAFT_137400 [Coniophora puteana RWD-64-598 SS2]EIW81475.1 hypothetical protein CONPUDRAFT_137400 [Coniophora puteana RWD-64-598 SS2]